MEKDAVPQDVASTYGGQRKLFYAVDAGGEYTSVHSSGWEVETAATLAAVDEYHRLRDEARGRVDQGLSATLEFHIYDRRMDLAALAQATGIWQWRIRRHLHPHRFKRLPARLLRRYAQALGLTTAELVTLP